MHSTKTRALIATVVLSWAFGNTTVRADITTRFFASGTFTGGETLGGYLDIDVTTGTVPDFNLTVGSESFTVNNVLGSGIGFVTFGATTASPPFDEVELIIPVSGTTVADSNLIDYTGGPLSTFTYFLPDGAPLPPTDLLVSGSLSAVPEPSTAIVAAFGAVAFMAYGWSRHRREQRRQAAA
jgi:hypothetical protein